MTRLSLTLALGTALCLGATPPPGERAVPVAEHSCKPQPPLQVELLHVGQAGARQSIEFTIRPLRPMSSVEWAFALPDDAALVAGEPSGRGGTGPDDVTSGRIELVLPQDDRYRRVRLLARGVFEGSDETGATFDEPVVATATLHWGEPEISAPVVWTTDGETGDRIAVVAMPTGHRQGR